MDNPLHRDRHRFSPDPHCQNIVQSQLVVIFPRMEPDIEFSLVLCLFWTARGGVGPLRPVQHDHYHDVYFILYVFGVTGVGILVIITLFGLALFCLLAEFLIGIQKMLGIENNDP